MSSPNTQLRFALGFTLPSLIALLGITSTANAEECGDVTCDTGFTCNTYETICPEDDAACDDTPFHSCDRAACENDADCGDYMVCGTFENFCDVTAETCAEGEQCPEDQCQPGEFKQCAAAWELPCEADADCGDGFACKPIEVCECEGFAAEPEPAGDAAPAEPACTCVPGDENYCEVQAVDCEDASACPTDWTCEDALRLCDSENGCEGEGSKQCQPPYAKVYGPSSGPVVFLADGAAENSPIAESGIASGNAPRATTQAGEDDSDNDASAAEGGCNMVSTPNREQYGLGWLALGLGLVLGARSRRRVSR